MRVKTEFLSAFTLAIALSVSFLASSDAVAQSAKPTMPAKGQKSVFGDWRVITYTDKMTDTKRCRITHAKLPYLSTNETGNLLYISFHRRGGIGSYKIRMGKNPASELRLASEEERSSDQLVVRLFDDEIGDADRVLVQGLTMLKDPIDEDISLVGYREARGEIKRQCP